MVNGSLKKKKEEKGKTRSEGIFFPPQVAKQTRKSLGMRKKGHGKKARCKLKCAGLTKHKISQVKKKGIGESPSQEHKGIFFFGDQE